MSRLPRNYTNTPFFHVITQGIEKSYIFEKAEDIKYYVKIMYKIKEEHNINIIAYCIMNNHTHMLAETKSIEQLSKYMQRINTTYGKYYNKKYSRVGYVFRDRYFVQTILNEKQLFNCIAYIHKNPINAGIVKLLSSYNYSSYNEYIDITIKEFELLSFFMRNKHAIQSRDQIITAVWGINYEGSDRVVDSLVKKLRLKLKGASDYIHTAYGMGYYFELPVKETA